MVQIRSVNHRSLDMELDLPEGNRNLEPMIRALIASKIRRGRIWVDATVEMDVNRSADWVDWELAKVYWHKIDRMGKELGIDHRPSLEAVLGLPFVVGGVNREMRPLVDGVELKRAVNQALDRLVKMRESEGMRLAVALIHTIDAMVRWTNKIKARVPRWRRSMERKLTEKIQRLVKKAGKDCPTDQAVLAEAREWLRSYDVEEELDRIASHLTALREMFGGKKAKEGVSSFGRTVEFLAQELQREVHTLSAKLKDATMTSWAIRIKDKIEVLREQAANLE